LKKFLTVEQICEEIFELEKSHNLLALDVGGVKIWQLMRMSAYYDIARATGVLEVPHSSKKRSKRSFKKITSYLLDLTKRNPLLSNTSVASLVLPHHRKVVADGQLTDIYTETLIRRFEDRGESYAIIEKSNKVWFLDALPGHGFRDYAIRLMGKLSLRFRNVRLSEDDMAVLRKVETLLNQTFGVNVPFYCKSSFRLRKYLAEYSLHESLLKRLSPDRIYIVVAYSLLWGGITKVAKDLGIPVVELQHGVFSRYHLGYSYPENNIPLDFFPDRLFTWGGYWSSMLELPLDKSDIINFGFEHFHKKRRDYIDHSKKKNQILVLSQEAIGERLAQKVHELLPQLEDYQIVYKLHPSEYARWEKREWFGRLSSLRNVEIIAGNADLYALFAESEYQFGVFSTAIFEGIGMGCKTILFDLPGVEYMEPLIKSGLCVKYDKREDITITLARAGAIDTGEASVFLFGEDRSERSSEEILPLVE
jgi:hypothetical protein